MAGRMNRLGFTLVEAIIVIVVIDVILAVTIPWMYKQELERKRLLARNEAMTATGYKTP